MWIYSGDWAGNSMDRKSTSGYCFSVGSGMVSWCSRKKKSVALSSTEAEYMAASTTTCEAIWLLKLLVNLFMQKMKATSVYCDNQSCIKLYENPVFHDRSKHIDIRCRSSDIMYNMEQYNYSMFPQKCRL